MSLSLSRPSSLLALALLLAPGLAVLPSAAATPGALAVQELPATQALRELYTREWQWRQQEEGLERVHAAGVVGGSRRGEGRGEDGDRDGGHQRAEPHSRPAPSLRRSWAEV